MLFWTIFLYTLGAFFALRSLISLMTQHKHHYEQKLRRQLAREASRTAQSEKEGTEAPKSAPAKAKPSAA